MFPSQQKHLDLVFNRNILFQVIFWKEFGFPVPLDRIMEFVHGKVGAAEAVIRAATLLLTGKIKYILVFSLGTNSRGRQSEIKFISFPGLFTFRLVGFLWALEISTHHSGRYESLTTAACKVPFGVRVAIQ